MIYDVYILCHECQPFLRLGVRFTQRRDYILSYAHKIKAKYQQPINSE